MKDNSPWFEGRYDTARTFGQSLRLKLKTSWNGVMKTNVWSEETVVQMTGAEIIQMFMHHKTPLLSEREVLQCSLQRAAGSPVSSGKIKTAEFFS